MKSIASLEADVVDGLLELLKQAAIPVQIQTTTQEGGLDISEIMVEDGDYDRACDVAERWEAARVDAAEKRSGWCCPRCGSKHLIHVPLANGMPSFKCKQCGDEFLNPVKWRT